MAATASGTHPRGKDAPPRRRWLGRALLVAALVLAAQAAWLPAKAALAQVLLQSAWTQARGDGGAHRPWPWADTHPVARLSQDRLGISQVVLAGDNGRTLAFGPGWAEASDVPGGTGTTVISGHRDSHFAWLRDLRDGDRVRLETADGEVTYRVRARAVRDARTQRLATPSGAGQLLLVTCWPFDAVAPRGPMRYVVVLSREPTPLPSASSG